MRGIVCVVCDGCMQTVLQFTNERSERLEALRLVRATLVESKWTYESEFIQHHSDK